MPGQFLTPPPPQFLCSDQSLSRPLFIFIQLLSRSMVGGERTRACCFDFAPMHCLSFMRYLVFSGRCLSRFTNAFRSRGSCSGSSTLSHHAFTSRKEPAQRSSSCCPFKPICMKIRSTEPLNSDRFGARPTTVEKLRDRLAVASRLVLRVRPKEWFC
ncbi:hypothetical protein BDW75DRAFT_203917 [Aspergillus navahoensis]